MLLWLLKKSPDVRTLLYKTFLLTFSIHIVLLCAGLFFFHGKTLDISINSSSDLLVPITVLPLQKTIAGALKNLNNRGSKKPEAVQKNKSEKKELLKKEKINKRIIIERELKSKRLKKVKVKPEVKKLKKIKETETKKVEEKEIKQAEEIQAMQKHESNEPIYLGSRDMEMYEISKQLSEEVARHWRPPAGLPKNLKCKVKIFIDAEGKITGTSIEESSKSIAFDMSVKRDVVKTFFPKEVWGREINLTYGV